MSRAATTWTGTLSRAEDAAQVGAAQEDAQRTDAADRHAQKENARRRSGAREHGERETARGMNVRSVHEDGIVPGEAGVVPRVEAVRWTWTRSSTAIFRPCRAR